MWGRGVGVRGRRAHAARCVRRSPRAAPAAAAGPSHRSSVARLSPRAPDHVSARRADAGHREDSAPS